MEAGHGTDFLLPEAGLTSTSPFIGCSCILLLNLTNLPRKPKENYVKPVTVLALVMANNTPSAPPPARGGLSLYANLLDPKNASAPGTISSAPVSYNRPPEQDEAVKKQQALAGTSIIVRT